MGRWLSLLPLLALPAALAAQGLDVTITSPPPGEPVFGEVEFV